MKPLLLSILLVIVSLGTTLSLSSCTSNGGGSGDGTYSAPASLSPVQATNQMRSQYREEFR